MTTPPTQQIRQAALVAHQDWDWRYIETVTNNAIDASYQDETFKANLPSVIRPWYRKLGNEGVVSPG